jgi:hypothetical protein
MIDTRNKTCYKLSTIMKMLFDLVDKNLHGQDSPHD